LLAREIGGRAVAAANLHLTLAFVGDVDGARRDELRELLTALPRHGFTLTLDRVGEWRQARVAWVAPAAAPPLLGQLNAALAHALAAAQFPVESRPFHPHVTLVRRHARAPADSVTAPLDWRVARVALMVSEHAGGALRYRELDAIVLAP
jgi:2'-5' RNA ligase